MARVFIIYGQPATGKTYSLRNLDPATTVIIDGDTKGALCWRGWKKYFGKDKKNLYQIDDIATITDWVKKIGEQRESKIKTLVIDGFNTAMSLAKNFNPDTSFNGWKELGKSILNVVRASKVARDNLDVIIIGHVETADADNPSSIDHLKTPGKLVSDIGLESMVLYVFYAKFADGKYFFETQNNRSSARSPEGCFPPTIPNDIKAAIDIIDAYDNGEEIKAA